MYFYARQPKEALILDEVANIIAKDKNIVDGESTLQGDKNVVTLYCFPGVSMFEFQPWKYCNIFFQFFCIIW
jgi:hypothetical protein